MSATAGVTGEASAGDGNDTVTNAGLISGSVTLGKGDDKLTNSSVTARIGAKVQWRNQDGVLHRIVQDRAGDDGNNSGDPYGPNPGGGSSAGGFRPRAFTCF